MTIITILTVHKPFYKTLINTAICIAALSANEQALATHFSIPASPDLNTPTASDWTDTGCGTTPTPVGSVTNADDFHLCGSNGGGRSPALIATLSGTIPISGALTLENGSSVTASGDVTFSANGVNFSNDGVLNLATYTLTMPTNSTLSNSGTLTLGSPAVPHSLYNFTHTIFGGTSTLGNAKILGNLTIDGQGGTGLTLSAANTVAGNVTLSDFMVNNLSGVLKFTVGNHTISTSGTQTIPNLDLSGMVTGNTIAIAGNGVTITAVSGGNFACPSGTPYVAGSAIGGGTTCTITANAAPVSASIDFIVSKKLQTFEAEVKIK
ncbi:MAG: hypothetical protein PHP00_15390 [Thiotrichaceae bacterium]|nr:hypothetical protein [Thiotrichaceae bacterium]